MHGNSTKKNRVSSNPSIKPGETYRDDGGSVYCPHCGKKGSLYTIDSHIREQHPGKPRLTSVGGVSVGD